MLKFTNNIRLSQKQTNFALKSNNNMAEIDDLLKLRILMLKSSLSHLLGLIDTCSECEYCIKTEEFATLKKEIIRNVLMLEKVGTESGWTNLDKCEGAIGAIISLNNELTQTKSELEKTKKDLDSSILQLKRLNDPNAKVIFNDDKKKIDFIRVIYILNELGYFVGRNGKKAKKRDIFEAFGKAVDISLDSFSQDWNMQFMRADDTSRYIEIFQEMEQVMRKIAKEKLLL